VLLIYLFVLFQIRAKQSIATQIALTRDSATEQRLLRLSRLPDFIRIIRMYVFIHICLSLNNLLFFCRHFTTECKASMPNADVVEKLAQSYGAMISKGSR
jgi:hypothetical protein